MPHSDAPLVSVIMPNLDKGRYVGDAIESILNQSYENFELLFVDNGSKDTSREIAQQCCRRDKRLLMLSEPIKGVTHARNRGLTESHGELITFLDSDDVCNEHRLEKQVALLEEDRTAAGCHTNGWIIGEKGAPTGEIFHPDCVSLPAEALGGRIFHQLLKKNFVMGMSMMLRRDSLEGEVFDTRLGYGEDFDLWLRLAHRHRLTYVPEPLYGYRTYSENAPWTLLWSHHPLIYEKWLNSPDLAGDDRRVVIEKLLRLYRRNNSYKKLLHLLMTEATARDLTYDYVLHRSAT
ncbi:MAG: glycosyltransferase [Nitrososphaerales archaeon]